MVDSWIDGSNTLKCLKVGPGEKLILHSSVGEWHLNTIFPDYEDWEPWNKKGFCVSRYSIIGKFRSDPCASGNYSWLEYDDPFECIYSELKEPIENASGLMTFCQKT
jgi:hypothetical protein